MKNIGLVILLVIVILAALHFKAWQCGEMFPDASLVACLFWK